MTYLIYIIIDPITHGVVYVGRTRDIEKRKSDYLRFNRVHSVKIKKYFEEMAIKKVVPIFIVIGEI